MASKVYYHLGSFQDSLSYALGAGQKFNVNGTSEYIETMLCEWVGREGGEGVRSEMKEGWLRRRCEGEGVSGNWG